MYVRCDESSLYSRINYVHSPDGELLCGECPGIIKTMHTGFKRVHVLHYANAPVAWKKPDVMIWKAWKDLCSASECSQ